MLKIARNISRVSNQAGRLLSESVTHIIIQEPGEEGAMTSFGGRSWHSFCRLPQSPSHVAHNALLSLNNLPLFTILAKEASTFAV